MSLTIRCPACETRLEFVPDQLLMAHGWVRCGRCQDVFEARTQTVRPWGETDFAGFHRREVSSQPAPEAWGDVPELPPEHPAAGPLETPEHRASAFEGATDELQDGVLAIPILRRPALPDEAGEDLPASERARSFDAAASTGGRFAQDRQGRRTDRAGTLPPFMPTEHAQLADVSFMRNAPRGAMHSPKLPFLMLVAAAMLFVLLVIQIALQHRDRLAATAPTLIPALEYLCSRLNCKVGPARQIDALVIDNSSLSNLGGHLQFFLAVRNQSDIELAMPAFELTLTDSQDRPVVRRVLLPVDLGTNQSIAPGGEWAGSVTVEADSGDRVAGYRVVAFYP